VPIAYPAVCFNRRPAISLSCFWAPLFISLGSEQLTAIINMQFDDLIARQNCLELKASQPKLRFSSSIIDFKCSFLAFIILIAPFEIIILPVSRKRRCVWHQKLRYFFVSGFI